MGFIWMCPVDGPGPALPGALPSFRRWIQSPFTRMLKPGRPCQATALVGGPRWRTASSQGGKPGSEKGGHLLHHPPAVPVASRGEAAVLQTPWLRAQGPGAACPQGTGRGQSAGRGAGCGACLVWTWLGGAGRPRAERLGPFRDAPSCAASQPSRWNRTGGEQCRPWAWVLGSALRGVGAEGRLLGQVGARLHQGAASLDSRPICLPPVPSGGGVRAALLVRGTRSRDL